jgi:hypothetical protein
MGLVKFPDKPAAFRTGQCEKLTVRHDRRPNKPAVRAAGQAANLFVIKVEKIFHQLFYSPSSNCE